MAIEINQAVKMPTVSNYSTQRVVVDSSTSVKADTSMESTVSGSNFSVTPAKDLNTEENRQGGRESGSNREQPTEKEVKSKIDQANNELRHAKTGLDFKYHEATKRVSITVYDKDTKEVIREIPPEKTLDMLEKMWELAGMVVDDKR